MWRIDFLVFNGLDWWTYKNVTFKISSKSADKWRIRLLGGPTGYCVHVLRKLHCHSCLALTLVLPRIPGHLSVVYALVFLEGVPAWIDLQAEGAFELAQLVLAVVGTVVELERRMKRTFEVYQIWVACLFCNTRRVHQSFESSICLSFIADFLTSKYHQE